MTNSGYVLQCTGTVVTALLSAQGFDQRRQEALAGLAPLCAMAGNRPDDDPWREPIEELGRLLRIDCDVDAFERAGQLASSLHSLSVQDCLGQPTPEDVVASIEDMMSKARL